MRAPLRNCLYAAMRLHRACAIVGMRRCVRAGVPRAGRGPGGGCRCWGAGLLLPLRYAEARPAHPERQRQPCASARHHRTPSRPPRMQSGGRADADAAAARAGRRLRRPSVLRQGARRAGGILGAGAAWRQGGRAAGRCAGGAGSAQAALQLPACVPGSARALTLSDGLCWPTLHLCCCPQAVLVNSSILPILLQALVLQLPLALQAAVQVRARGGSHRRAACSSQVALLLADCRTATPRLPRQSHMCPSHPLTMTTYPPTQPSMRPCLPPGGGRLHRHPRHARLLRQPGGRRRGAGPVWLAGAPAGPPVCGRHGRHVQQVGGEQLAGAWGVGESVLGGGKVWRGWLPAVAVVMVATSSGWAGGCG